MPFSLKTVVGSLLISYAIAYVLFPAVFNALGSHAPSDLTRVTRADIRSLDLPQ